MERQKVLILAAELGAAATVALGAAANFTLKSIDAQALAPVLLQQGNNAELWAACANGDTTLVALLQPGETSAMSGNGYGIWVMTKANRDKLEVLAQARGAELHGAIGAGEVFVFDGQRTGVYRLIGDLLAQPSEASYEALKRVQTIEELQGDLDCTDKTPLVLRPLRRGLDILFN